MATVGAHAHTLNARESGKVCPWRLQPLCWMAGSLCVKGGSSEWCGSWVNLQLSSKQEKKEWRVINGSHAQALAQSFAF